MAPTPLPYDPNGPDAAYSGTYQLSDVGFSYAGKGFTYSASASETHRWTWVTDYNWDPDTQTYYQMSLDEDPPVAEDWVFNADGGAGFSYDQSSWNTGSGSVHATINFPNGSVTLTGTATGTPDRWDYGYDETTGTYYQNQTAVYSFTQNVTQDGDNEQGFVIDGPNPEITITGNCDGSVSGDMDETLEFQAGRPQHAAPWITQEFTTPAGTTAANPNTLGTQVHPSGNWGGANGVAYIITCRIHVGMTPDSSYRQAGIFNVTGRGLNTAIRWTDDPFTLDQGSNWWHEARLFLARNGVRGRPLASSTIAWFVSLAN